MSVMDSAVRTRLLKQQRALLLAASDIRQARAAAVALEHEDDMHLARALETAMIVCFMRPFSAGDLRVPRAFFPKGEDADHVRGIKAHRDKIYAHTDNIGGRHAKSVSFIIDGTEIHAHFEEGWNAISRAAVPDFVALCDRTATLFDAGAVNIQMMFEGDVPAKPFP
jgi:hypothetical protein